MNYLYYPGLSVRARAEIKDYNTPTTMIERIIGLVCSEFEITKEQILMKRRWREIVLPRQVAMYLIFHSTDMTKSAIAKVFGKDHATLIHSCKTVEDLMSVNKEFKKRVECLEALI